MKLILEKIGEEVYAYRESEAQFKKMEPSRGKPLDPATLDDDCALSNYGSFHMVFDIGRKPRKKK